MLVKTCRKLCQQLVYGATFSYYCQSYGATFSEFNYFSVPLFL